MIKVFFIMILTYFDVPFTTSVVQWEEVEYEIARITYSPNFASQEIYMTHIYLSDEVFTSLDGKNRQNFCLSIETFFASMVFPGRPILIVVLESDFTPEDVSKRFDGEVKHILPLDEITEPEI